jgi:transcriptional regulator with XRE-family HTH domain
MTVQISVVLDPNEIGRRIAAARRRKGWTQLDLALRAHVSPSSISKWERGRLPPVPQLIRLAEVMEIDPGELVAEPTLTGEILAKLDEILAELREK